MKAFYSFPAVYHHADDGISISFPDLPGCFSCAFADEDARTMACDALELMLFTMLNERKKIPCPTSQDDIMLGDGESVHLIKANMTHARRLASIQANRHQLFKNDDKSLMLTVPFTEEELPKRMTESLLNLTGIDPDEQE